MVLLIIPSLCLSNSVRISSTISGTIELPTTVSYILPNQPVTPATASPALVNIPPVISSNLLVTDEAISEILSLTPPAISDTVSLKSLMAVIALVILSTIFCITSLTVDIAVSNLGSAFSYNGIMTSKTLPKISNRVPSIGTITSVNNTPIIFHNGFIFSNAPEIVSIIPGIAARMFSAKSARTGINGVKASLNN